jgi:hypothetical protein
VSALLIDDRGKIWDPHSLVLRSRLHASLEGRELIAYAISNLGFIGLGLTKESIQIRLRPVLVRPAALGTLYVRLHMHARQRIVVTWYNGRWQDEIIGWHHDGWRRITRLLESPEQPGPGFSRRHITPDQLADNNPLRRVLERASDLAGIIANPTEALPAGLANRHILLIEDDNRDLRVCHVGSALMSRSPQWQRQARGRRIDDLPDWHYGQWVADAYREAARSDRPLLEEVAAVIDWPKLGTLSHAYWRLIVPGVGSDGRKRLLGVTLEAGIGGCKAG